jgi:hypothetical protein
LNLDTDARGQLTLDIFSFRNPITIDPSHLLFLWDKGVPAYVHLADLRQINTYEQPWADEHIFHYAAVVVFASFPSKIGMHVLHIRPLGGFATTPTGPIYANPISIFMWRPDDFGDDRGLHMVRSRYLGRTIYAYGGARVGCHYVDTVYDWHAGLRVTSVKRERSRLELLVTGTTLSALPPASRAFSFVAIHPLKLRLEPNHGVKPLGKNGPGIEGDRETPCYPGMRFADPWHVAATITTAAPPNYIKAIHVGSSRSDVLWLSGYPDIFGTVERFERMKKWEFRESPPSSWSVVFRNDRVVRYHPPRDLP